MLFRLLKIAAIAMPVSAAVLPAQPIRSVDGGGGLHLTQSFGTTLLRETSGAVRELALPPGVWLRRLAALDGGWIAAGTGTEGDLYLLHHEGGAETVLPAPPRGADNEARSWPVPLVRDGQLVGLAWLSGPIVEQNSVWASTWTGLDWSQPERVAPSGPGSQLALDGTVLADGSWLLVWSAYDGTDDEIVFSVRTDSAWTEARPLHAANEAPDIVPAVVATDAGAIAAWSWFDGSDYRLKLASFGDGAWSELRFLGSRGSLYPRLSRTATGARALYRTVVPDTWTLLDLDPEGAVLARSVVEEPTSVHPAVVVQGDEVELQWLAPGALPPLRSLGAEWRPEP